MFTMKNCLQKRNFGIIKKRTRTSAQGYKVIDASLLQKLLDQCCVYRFCKKMGELEILEDASTRKGLSESLIFKCKQCVNETQSFTSKRTSSGISSFDANVLSTYDSLPFGREGLTKFTSTNT